VSIWGSISKYAETLVQSDLTLESSIKDAACGLIAEIRMRIFLVRSWATETSWAGMVMVFKKFKIKIDSKSKLTYDGQGHLQ
jgi:hypothetical protein